MASSPITSWQIDGKTMETVTDFIFLGSKITADGDCSHEIKRHLLFGIKAMTNLDSLLFYYYYYFLLYNIVLVLPYINMHPPQVGSILKNRDVTLPTKICLVKDMVFLVIMYGCESWTIKKAEC